MTRDWFGVWETYELPIIYFSLLFCISKLQTLMPNYTHLFPTFSIFSVCAAVCAGPLSRI